MKSDAIKQGIERAPHRSLLYALGCTPEEMSKPFVGIINSYSEIVPGHMHLDEISEAVKAGVRAGELLRPGFQAVHSHWMRSVIAQRFHPNP